MDKKKLDVFIKCIAAVVAVFLFVVLVQWTKNYDKGTAATYEIVCLGDSNFGNTRNETGIVAQISEKTGKKALNAAFGGSMMTNQYSMKTEYHSALSMHNIAISMCNRNFGVQKSAIDTVARTDYVGHFQETLENLSEVDFEKVEILLIEHGVNDYMSGVPIKNGVNPYDTDTFLGTIRTVVKMLEKEYPNLRIILVTPAYCTPYTASDGQFHPCDEYSYGGGFLEDYVNAELEVAKELGVEIIDMYHGIDMNADNASAYLYDGLHLNETGREMAAGLIAEYILGEAQ